MVSSSVLSPASMEQQEPIRPLISDHNYSKTSQAVDIVDPLSPEAPAGRSTPTAGVAQSEQLTSQTSSTWCDNRFTCSAQQLARSNRENTALPTDFDDMFCDLDDLDFNLSDFDMDTDADATYSFQDYIDPTFTFSDLSTISSSGVSLDHPHSAAAISAGKTLLNTSPFSSSCNSLPSPCPVYSDSCVLSPSREPKSTGAEKHATNSQADSSPGDTSPTVPTKMCSCLGAEAESFPLGLYSSCQRDSTTVSPSTLGSCQRENNSSGMTLRPEDYLPPLYIDTQCQEVSSPMSPHLSTSVTEGNVVPTLQVQLYDDTATTHNGVRRRNGSETLFPLAPPVFQVDLSSKSQQKQTGFQDHVDPSFTETSSDDDTEVIDELDLEAISDFERYLSEAGLDVRSLESSPLENSPPSTLSSSCTSCPYGCPEKEIDEKGRESRVGIAGDSVKDSEMSLLSGLRVSILHDFSDRLENDELLMELRDSSSVERKDSGRSHHVYHSRCEHSDTFSWSVKPGPDSTIPISLTGSSPYPSPAAHGYQSSPTSQMEWSSKEDLNILDLFSEENAHFFLDSDSAICHMNVSQFI